MNIQVTVHKWERDPSNPNGAFRLNPDSEEYASLVAVNLSGLETDAYYVGLIMKADGFLDTANVNTLRVVEHERKWISIGDHKQLKQ
jgi:hypothetical protein